MKHRLLSQWVVLWQYLGVRPIDVSGMTLDDALAVETFADEVARELRRRRSVASRRGRR